MHYMSVECWQNDSDTKMQKYLDKMHLTEQVPNFRIFRLSDGTCTDRSSSQVNFCYYSYTWAVQIIWMSPSFTGSGGKANRVGDKGSVDTTIFDLLNIETLRGLFEHVPEVPLSLMKIFLR